MPLAAAATSACGRDPLVRILGRYPGGTFRASIVSTRPEIGFLEIFFFALNIAVSESRDRLRRGDRMSRRRSGFSSSIEFVEVPSSGALARFGSHLLGEQALRLLIAFSCFLRGLNRRLACFSHQCARGAADVDRVRRRRRAGG